MTEEVIPPDLEAFDTYLAGMLRGEELRATPQSRWLVSGVLRPRVPPALRPAAEVVRLITLELLPPSIREMFDLRVGRGSRLVTAVAERSSRLLLPLLPDRLRTFSASRV
jgi:uncharacterized protein (DUF2236 family)